MKTPLKHMATLVAVLAATLVHAQAQLINNGNFADGGNNWTATTTGAGDAQFGNYNDHGWLYTNPPVGTTMAELGGAGNDSAFITQSLSSLTAGTYTLSFASAGIANYNPSWSAQLTWDPSVLGLRATVTSGANVLYDSGFQSAYQQDWRVYSGDFTLNSTVNDAVVKFSFQNTTYGTTGSHAYLGMSNASLQAVPEPSTYALVLGGIATLLLIRRRVQA
jgi:hypothetical protein